MEEQTKPNNDVAALTQILLLQQEKLDKIYVTVERFRKILNWTIIITLILFVIPLIGIIALAPSFISNITGNINGLGL